jgi:thioredoxin-related protein
MEPVVDRLRQEYAGKVDIKLMDLSGSDASAQELATRFAVEYVPTYVFADSDGTVRDRVVGETAESDMRARLDKLR